MGLFDFVKSAGAKLLGKDDEQEAKEQAQAASQEAAQMEEVRENLRRRKVEARLKLKIEELGLDIADAEYQYDGDTVTVSGTVASQEIREKILLAVGNNAGIGKVDDHINVEAPEPEATFYTVVSGDNLSKIAKAHYGNANKYHAIFEANRPMLEHPDKIFPGQVLRIPPMAEEG